MKALIKKEPTVSYLYTDVDVPSPGEGELLIKVTRVSLCGSDIALYHWNETAQKIAKLPFIPGHECVGEVVKVGTGCSEEFKVGSRVCCENHFYCGKCYQCTHDQKHICQKMNQYGHGKGTIHGGCSQFTIIPARYCYLLRTNIDDDLACLLEPFGVAHHAVEESSAFGDTVLVQGCGPIGLMAIGILKVRGASKIIALDIVTERLQTAKAIGADVVINGKEEDLKTRVMEETNGDGVGRIIEVSGADSLINNMFQLLRKGGTVVMVGIPKGALHVENAAQNVLFKSVHIKSLHGRKIFSTWEDSERLLAENKVDISRLISHRYNMSQYQEAFQVLLSGRGCKIILDPQH